MKSFIKTHPAIYALICVTILLLMNASFNALDFYKLLLGVNRYAGAVVQQLIMLTLGIIMLKPLVEDNVIHRIFSTKNFIPALLWGLPYGLYALRFLFIILQNDIMDYNQTDFFFIILMQAFVINEEVIYRGLLMTGLLLGLGKTRAGNVGIVILSGMIFGLSHFQYHNLETMIWMCIFTGIPFAAIYLNTGNLLVCMLLHASSNIFISSMNLLVPLEQQILINPVFNYYYQIIMLGLILICGIVQTLITKPRKVNPVINNE